MMEHLYNKPLSLHVWGSHQPLASAAQYVIFWSSVNCYDGLTDRPKDKGGQNEVVEVASRLKKQ